MPFPLVAPATMDLGISAIKALLRYRERIDSILSLREAGAGIPFALPPAGIDYSDYFMEMVNFYDDTPEGKLILELYGLMEEQFNQVKIDPGAHLELAEFLYLQYFQAKGIVPEGGPGDRRVLETGLSEDMRLAYFVVESHRLSRNPAVTRVLLATADTLLEVAGENAGFFVSDARTKGIVETLLREFADKHDFDDDSVEIIFKRLLGSAIIAAVENRGQIPYDHPGLDALFAAISDVRKDLGDNFVLDIFNQVGLEKLVSTYLVHIAQDPSFITNHELAKKVLSETLRKLAGDLKDIQNDPKALLGVLETTITVAAANVDGLLKRNLGEETLVTAVLTAVAKEISASDGPDTALFKDIANGELFAAIYKAVLQAVAVNPDKLANDAELKPFVAKLVSTLAGTLSKHEVVSVLQPETLQLLASRSLEVLATEPEFIVRDNAFAAKVVGAVLAAGAGVVKDGLQIDDLAPLSHAAITAAAGNIALVNLDDRFEAIIVSIGESLSEERIKGLLTPKGRRDALVGAVHAISANPKVWAGFEERNLVQPLVKGLIDGLSSDPTNLLSGPVLVNAFSKSLAAATRRGTAFVKDEVQPDEIRNLLVSVLREIDKEIGRGIDGENLPDFLERAILAFLKEPFPLGKPIGKNKVKALISTR